MNPKDKMGAKKPNLSVLPFAPLLEVVPALYEGRRKYGPWNWRAEKVSETIYADAAIRHLMQFIAGEDIDPESGVHHIAKAIAGLLVVRDAQLHGCSIDDRMVDQNLNIPRIMEQLAGVNERYPNPVESALPPRGLEAPCDDCEDEEKVAEYLGLVDEDDYEFGPDDVGTRVVGDDGRIGVIVAWEDSCPFGLNVKVQFGEDDPFDYNWYTPDGDLDEAALFNDADGHPDYVTRLCEGITGGSTMTEEDAEKVAEYLTRASFELSSPPTHSLVVKTDGKVSRWSTTVAGGGTYRIKPSDVDKKVEFRDGRLGTIIAFVPDYDALNIWPVGVKCDNSFIVTTTTYGQQSAYASELTGFVAEDTRDTDIVKVYHS